jgi:hypothetical protein
VEFCLAHALCSASQITPRSTYSNCGQTWQELQRTLIDHIRIAVLLPITMRIGKLSAVLFSRPFLILVVEKNCVRRTTPIRDLGMRPSGIQGNLGIKMPRIQILYPLGLQALRPHTPMLREVKSTPLDVSSMLLLQ